MGSEPPLAAFAKEKGVGAAAEAETAALGAVAEENGVDAAAKAETAALGAEAEEKGVDAAAEAETAALGAVAEEKGVDAAAESETAALGAEAVVEPPPLAAAEPETAALGAEAVVEPPPPAAAEPETAALDAGAVVEPPPPAAGAARRTKTKRPLRASTCKSFQAGVEGGLVDKYGAELQRLAARTDLPKDGRWVDSHCHLESILVRTPMDLPSLVAKWPAGVDSCINNAAFRVYAWSSNPSEWTWLEENIHYYDEGSSICEKLYFTIGVHPSQHKYWDDQAEAIVRRFAEHPRCVGIGECGIDFHLHPSDANEESQVRVFEAQCRLATELQKTLVVHARVDRDSADEILVCQVLEREMPIHHPIHVHCFGGSLWQAAALMHCFPNLYFGFTGAVTFRKRKQDTSGYNTDEILKTIPLERLLIETDGPYMCPEPFRGQVSHPGFVHRVAEKIAEVKGLPLGEVMAATRRNTEAVYGI